VTFGIERLLDRYDATYCGGMGAASRCFLRRFLQWQDEQATELLDREAVARCIDPDAWSRWVWHIRPNRLTRQRRALNRADALIIMVRRGLMQDAKHQLVREVSAVDYAPEPDVKVELVKA
jgi:hypothetical protein